LSLSFSFEAQQLLKHNRRSNLRSRWQPQVKLIDRGPAGVSLAPHWVLTGFESLGPFAIPGNAFKHFM